MYCLCITFLLYIKTIQEIVQYFTNPEKKASNIVLLSVLVLIHACFIISSLTPKQYINLQTSLQVFLANYSYLIAIGALTILCWLVQYLVDVIHLNVVKKTRGYLFGLKVKDFIGSHNFCPKSCGTNQHWFQRCTEANYSSTASGATVVGEPVSGLPALVAIPSQSQFLYLDTLVYSMHSITNTNRILVINTCF